MWRVAGASVRGTSHIEFDIPCQDYCSYQRLPIGSSSGLIIAIADGAGSARFSETGARVVVDHLLKIIDQSEATALQQGEELREFGCTILFALVGELASFFVQIGDGAWIVKRNDQYLAATWPSDGEYVNETTFLTSPNWAESIRCQLIDNVSAVAGFTDGLQRLALQLDNQTVYAPFFDPLFSVLRTSEDDSSLISPLMEFLASERVSDRTDDDKTLVLACQCKPLLLQC
jgi:Protein phosphatase 2C